jgi:o-succinylbenzoate synthase
MHNMLKLKSIRHRLYFRFEAGTSRGTMRVRDGLFLLVYDGQRPGVFGIGECGPLPGLSVDTLPVIEARVREMEVNQIPGQLETGEAMSSWLQSEVGKDLPSLWFGLEVALRDFFNGGKRMLFDNAFFHGQRALPINGLVWMSNRDFMLEQIKRKLADGFSCIKIKIGALDLDTELGLLKYIRDRFSEEVLELRLDANGAYKPEEAPRILEILARYQIHSIEQPVRPGQWKTMAKLCRDSPIPVALDEELIGVGETEDRAALLDELKPAFLVLKPTLLGGFDASANWIGQCDQRRIGWWVTSALESNVGLNAVAQFVSQYDTVLPQGLGTGQLYTNNIGSPLVLEGERLMYDPGGRWDIGHFSP